MKLSAYLEAQGLTDEAFASMVGVNRTTISRLRRTGQRPAFDTLNAIAAATGGKVTADDFWLSAPQGRAA